MRPDVVLEAGQGLDHPGLELTLEQDVADHPSVARDRLERQQPNTRHIFAVEASVAAAEELVAAADREERRAAFEHGLLERLGLPREVLRDEQLLAVLAAAHVVEIVLAGHDRGVHAEGAHREVVSSECGAAREHGDVAAVGVDVEVVGIEVPDADRAHAVCSQ